MSEQMKNYVYQGGLNFSATTSNCTCDLAGDVGGMVAVLNRFMHNGARLLKEEHYRKHIGSVPALRIVVGTATKYNLFIKIMTQVQSYF